MKNGWKGQEEFKDESLFLGWKEIAQYYPWSKSNFMVKVKAGEYPQPIRASERCSRWRREDIENLLKQLDIFKG